MRNLLGNVSQLVVFLAGLFLVPAAHALEIYGGASAVHSTMPGMCDGGTGNTSFSGSCDDTGTGFKAFAGLQLIPLTAVELGYIDFGQAQATGTVRIVGPVGIIGEFERYPKVGNASTTGEANVNAFSLGLVVRF